MYRSIEYSRNSEDILAIIPARGGSKGIPKKNLAELGGIPLVAYSILAAQSCSLITRIVVSTDDEEIAAVAKKCGAEVPFLRPENLSGSSALIGDAVTYTLNELEKRERYCPSAFVTLYPTHPFRSKSLMDQLVGKLVQGFNPVITVKKMDVAPLSYFFEANGTAKSLHGNRHNVSCYRRYGIFIGQRLYNTGVKCIYAYELKHNIDFIDIDTPQDLIEANKIISNKQFMLEWIGCIR